MKWIAATVSTRADMSSGEVVAEILADLFYGLGLKGVVINDAPEENGARISLSVTGYFPDNASIAENRFFLEASARSLSVEGMSPCRVSYTEIDEEDWADSWKKHFYPRRIGRHLVVKPTWRKYRPEPGDLVIEMDPGMAFGTGTHATTRLCLIMLEQHLKKGMSFLDVGTGTGILMVAAFRLGAETIRGVDNDPVAVEIARENLALNRVPPDQSGVSQADLVNKVDESFDVICANILADVVVALIPDIRRVLAPDGLFVCSGIIRAKRDLVADALDRFGFGIVAEMTEEEWVCITAKVNSATGTDRTDCTNL